VAEATEDRCVYHLHLLSSARPYKIQYSLTSSQSTGQPACTQALPYLPRAQCPACLPPSHLIEITQTQLLTFLRPTALPASQPPHIEARRTSFRSSTNQRISSVTCAPARKPTEASKRGVAVRRTAAKGWEAGNLLRVLVNEANFRAKRSAARQ
jgi:hypothetical protein